MVLAHVRGVLREQEPVGLWETARYEGRNSGGATRHTYCAKRPSSAEALVDVGGRPICGTLMKLYAHYGLPRIRLAWGSGAHHDKESF